MVAITIERIEAIPLRIRMDHWAPPPLFAGRPRTTIDTLMVRVATNRGVVGWGEAYGGGWQATVAASPLALGQDATDAGLTPRLERALHNLGRAGPVIHAISGLDIALWDLRGKSKAWPCMRFSAVVGGGGAKPNPPCLATGGPSGNWGANWRVVPRAGRAASRSRHS